MVTQYPEKRRYIPGSSVAMGSGAAFAGAAAYLGRKAQLTARNKSGQNANAATQAKWIRRKAGKAGLIGGALLAGGYGLKRLNDEA